MLEEILEKVVGCCQIISPVSVMRKSRHDILNCEALLVLKFAHVNGDFRFLDSQSARIKELSGAFMEELSSKRLPPQHAPGPAKPSLDAQKPPKDSLT